MDNVTCVVVDPLKEPEPEKPAKGSGGWLKAHLGPVIFAVAFVAILAAGIGGAYAYAHNSFFVIAEDGVVCVYRGLPGSVAGIKANWLEEKTDIPVDKLSPTTASRLEGGLAVDSLDDAQALLTEYRHLIGAEPSDKADGDGSRAQAKGE